MKYTYPMFFVFFTLLLPAWLPEASAQPAANLVGSWQAKEGPLTILLMLNSDGTGKLDDEAIKYTLTENILSVHEGGVINKYTYQLSGTKLTLSGGDLEKPMVFERQGVPASTGLGGRRAQPASAESKPIGPTSPAGAWETQGPNGTIRMLLRPDGTGTFGGGSVRWQFEQDILNLTGPNGKTIPYNAILTANSLTLSGSNLTEPVVFKRIANETDSAPAAKADRAKGEDSLVGTWQGSEETVQINGDGSLLINSVAYRYSLQGNILTLIGSDGSLPLPYELSGNTLTVTMSGRSVALKRITADSGASQEVGSGGGMAEIVGKWCYFSSFSAVSGGGSMTDECFTINPDGTFSYHREASMSAYAPGIYGGTASQTDDSGTCSLSGSRLTVNSRTQGTSSYTLVKRNNPKNGDPMLCLDNRCYVTYYQRAPWR